MQDQDKSRNPQLSSLNSASNRGQTGPKTAEGKKRSSMNALKHGLYATTEEAMEMINEDVGITFEEIHKEIDQIFHPTDALARRLVKRVALCLWRLARAEAMEKRAMTSEPGSGKPNQSLDKIMKYERLVDIHLHRALAVLERQRMPISMRSRPEVYMPKS